MYSFLLLRTLTDALCSLDPNALPRQGKLQYSEQYTERQLLRHEILNKTKVLRRQEMEAGTATH